MRLSFIFIIIMFYSCNMDQTPVELDTHVSVKPGEWRFELDLGEQILPFNVKITEDYMGELIFIIKNAEEEIVVESIKIINDSLFFDMPLFSSKFEGKILSSEYMTGYWNNYSRETDNLIPFTAEYGENYRFADSTTTSVILKPKYEVTFNPNDDAQKYKAIGLFQTKENNRVYGTFLTETGDFRYLEGNISGDNISLSCFDGSHAFLFKAKVSDDQLSSGMFYSGKHYEAPFEGVANNSFELTDPNKITKVVNKNDWRNVIVTNENNQEIFLSDLNIKDKVVIIQIMGSWCPNCIDESRYYKELYSKYNFSDLEIIGVSFENKQAGFKGIQRLKKRLDLPYNIYLGGQRTKDAAKNLFPMLNNISSFPTSIIIDKKGKIRKIHTGFYGPGTGEYYEEYTQEMDAFIKELVMEEQFIPKVQ